MSTMVLEEAILFGRPVIKINHPDYLEYIDIKGMQGVGKKDYNEVSFNDLSNITNTKVNYEEMRNRLAIDYPEATYKQLFLEKEIT